MENTNLHITLGDSNRPHVESIEDFDSSLFKQQYNLCFKQIESILLSNPSENVDGGQECNNNIIVFDGERGSGKTSCMLSVATMLAEGNMDFFQSYPKLREQKFVQLPMLEPSFFDKEHNSVTLFVSRLYKEYLKEDKACKSSQKRHNLLNQFVKVQQDIKCILGEFEPKDGLEYLVGLSSAIELREDLRGLVNLFLEYIEKPDSKLLVLIDDIDINPKMAEDMAEQVRKYLVLPNVIVLMSMKVEQMTDILHENYSHEYNDPKNDKIRDEINNRVEKYITKLFPRSQRVFMPRAESVLNCTLILDDKKLWKYDLPDNLYIRQIVPELIFKKTRYLFYNTNKRASFIVPRNLRDLRQLLHLLLMMPDYADEKEIHVHNENKRAFKKYLFEDWTASNLNERQRELVAQLVSVEMMEELNYTTIRVLSNVTERFRGTLAGNTSIGEALDGLNNAANISLGDVLSLIRILENAEPEEANRRLLFFIRTLYSIRLYEAYDMITMSREQEQNKLPLTIINKGLHRNVKSDYDAIIGGSVCNAEIFDFLPKVSENVRSSTRFITKEAVVALSNSCVEKWDYEDGIYVKLMEFIMLSVYYDSASNANTQNNFRRSDSVCYRSINSGAEEYRFDLGAFIYNVSRPKEAIDRFRTVPELRQFFKKYGSYEKGKRLMQDLYALMNDEKCREKEYKTIDERWLSFCCFRNMEILEDFLNYIRGHVQRALEKQADLDPSKSIDSVISFFKLASNYFIKSYDRYETKSDKNNAYDIHFHFYKVICGLMTNRTFKDEFEKVFYSKEVKNGSQNEKFKL